MLSLEIIESFLLINEKELLHDFLNRIISAPPIVPYFNKSPQLHTMVSQELPTLMVKLAKKIKETPLPENFAQEFTLYQQLLAKPGIEFYQQLPSLLLHLEQQESPFIYEAHSLYSQSIPRRDSFHTIFLQRWRLSLIARTVTLHHQIQEQERSLIQEELLKRLKNNQILQSVLALNDNAAGRLWDLSRYEQYQCDYRLLIQYGDFLAHQPELQQLAEQLGRSYLPQVNEQNSTKQETFKAKTRELAIVPEEVHGLTQSNDLLRLVPIELSTLGVDVLEWEFYRRLLEKRLLTYLLQGEVWQEHEFQRPVIYHKKQYQPRGPFIICVDTSGSMGDFNEQWAKALSLALLRIALADGRRCYIMLFTTEIIKYELTADDGIKQAIRFLSQRFRGGTDLAQCLSHTMTLLSQLAWQQADAVVISDFVAQHLSEQQIKQIKKLQQQDHHCFHAVALSDYGKPAIMRIFDHIWHFNTGSRKKLLSFYK